MPPVRRRMNGDGGHVTIRQIRSAPPDPLPGADRLSLSWPDA